ncbi:hypothetical protein [Prosthecomicrobium pneumaticum]|uniref:Lipoprotein n=1 Tax=Prosthecomicrobium pneumaticum TaxID=81895 RepID=A0A7W9FPS3_9HYPH|nr:hypothetical protein [Prosthecomicrobium pneumaticum]MBB5754633.1 hypothetical protein [Prosthecomicrobium pneumaticum]
MRCALVVIAVAGAVLAGCNPFEPKMIGFCESVLKERLRSPSTYRRIAATKRAEPLTTDEWLARRAKSNPKQRATDEIVARVRQSAGASPALIKVTLEYDAANAFGTPLRGFALCEYLSDDGKDPTGAWAVTVDGETDTDFLIRQLREARP